MPGRTLFSAALAVLGVLAISPVIAQTPAPSNSALQFEVASLKPSAPGGTGGGVRPAPGGRRYEAQNATLRLLLTVAYRVKADQITGGPDWLDTARFDMNAEAEKPSSVEELHVMLKNLLTERFKLQLHAETKERPVYVLSVDKGAPKMTSHDAASAGDPWIDISGFRKLSAKFCPMDYFAFRLSLLLDRTVLDRTGLKGGYDFDLTYLPDLPSNLPEGARLNGVLIDTAVPNIFVAVRQQLGLKLDPQKGPVETLAIDHAEKLSEN